MTPLRWMWGLFAALDAVQFVVHGRALELVTCVIGCWLVELIRRVEEIGANSPAGSTPNTARHSCDSIVAISVSNIAEA